MKLLSNHGNASPPDESMFGMQTLVSDLNRQSRGCVIWSEVASELTFTLDNSLGFVNGYWHNTISACQNVLHNEMMLYGKNITSTWRHHGTDMFSLLLAICKGIHWSLANFPCKGSVMQSSGISFVFRPVTLLVITYAMMLKWCYLWNTKGKVSK